MKIVAVMGTARRNGTGARLLRQMEEALRAVPEVELNTIWLGDLGLQHCRGCKACYSRGEEACPLKDGFLPAMRRLDAADAAIFYSPTYTLSVSGLMKTFFDRASYVLHRPCFKGRPALVLTAVEVYGGKPALATLKRIVAMMGFSVSGQLAVVNVRDDASPARRMRTEQTASRLALRLTRQAASPRLLRPSFYELIVFQFQKAVFGAGTPGFAGDRRYWLEAGWTKPEAVFYCPARVSPLRAWLAGQAAKLLRRSGLV